MKQAVFLGKQHNSHYRRNRIPQAGGNRRPRNPHIKYFHIGVLCFAFAEYLLWTVGCFWPDTSPASPVFWCDMLLTLTILGLLPAVRKAVDA